MYIEFTSSIAPHLNRGGKYYLIFYFFSMFFKILFYFSKRYRCEIDNVVTYCTTSASTVYERRIAILINKDLNPNATTPAIVY